MSSRLVLASASPQRQSLLRDAGFQFVVHPANVDETVRPGLLPVEVARTLAMAKAQAVSLEYPDNVVLGADTVVAFGDLVLGKPADAAHAQQMLELLAGTTHIVITGVAVVHRSANYSKINHAMAAVKMKNLMSDEIQKYIASNDWQGKAGGYGIQDADPFVMRIAGSHTNIIGLPMGLTKTMLAEAGVQKAKKTAEGSF